VIEALPTCVPEGGQAKYPPVRYGDYLMERIDKNYHYRKGAGNRTPADPFPGDGQDRLGVAKVRHGAAE
jgi:hypothetical protein